MWIDVGKLIREHVPDKNGKTLPAELTSGSYEFRDLTDAGVGSLFEGKVIYDKTYGHVAYGCNICCGFRNPTLFYDPLGIPLLGTAPSGVTAYDTCWDTYDDVSGNFYYNWTTANTSVATVDSYATHTGRAVGATTSSAWGMLLADGRRVPCPQVRFTPRGGDNVLPTISGPNTVWYFSGQNPSGYATSITLTSSAGAQTTWTVTAGGPKVNLSTTTGATTTITSSGSSFSSSVGDVKLTATANGQTSAPFSLTTRTPSLTVAGTITTICDPTVGYLTTLNYTIEDQLNSTLPSGIPVNENWTTGVVKDYSGTNWRQINPNGVVEPGSAFADLIGGEDFALPPTPQPTCDGNSTAIEHWGQEWRVGSTAPGIGRRIQTDTLQKYKGRAAHLSIVSPAP